MEQGKRIVAIKPAQWTNDQKLVVNALLSILGSALLAGVSAIVMNANNAPEAVNISISLSIFVTAFVGSCGQALYNYLPAHWQVLIQAQQDTIAQLQSTQQSLQETHSVTVAALSKAVQQPVTQNAVGPSQPQQAPIAIRASTVNVTGGATATLAPLAEEAPTKEKEEDTSGGDTVPRMQAALSQSQQLV